MQELATLEIGHYHILRHLARGGMANVYLAQDTQKMLQVAIKMVHSSAVEYCERFRQEARALTGLSHPHILPVFDYGEHESWSYLVMPYIENGTLHERLKQQPLTLEKADEILTQLASALQFAHDQGIIHRDIKPANVLMLDEHHLYLADFGLVKHIGEEKGLTVTGYVIGTPEYMAPELADEEATPLSDLYALGILLYQMLTGSTPFKDGTPMGIFLQQVRDLPESPSARNPAIPDSIEQVILKAIEKDPQRRFQSAQEFAQAYHQALLHYTMESNETIAQIAHLQAPQITLVKIPQKPEHSLAPALLLLGALLVSMILLFVPGMMYHSSQNPDAHSAGKYIATPQTTPAVPAHTSINTGSTAPTPTLTPTPTPPQPAQNVANTAPTPIPPPDNNSAQNAGNNNLDATNANAPNNGNQQEQKKQKNKKNGHGNGQQDN